MVYLTLYTKLRQFQLDDWTIPRKVAGLGLVITNEIRGKFAKSSVSIFTLYSYIYIYRTFSVLSVSVSLSSPLSFCFLNTINIFTLTASPWLAGWLFIFYCCNRAFNVLFMFVFCLGLFVSFVCGFVCL